MIEYPSTIIVYTNIWLQVKCFLSDFIGYEDYENYSGKTSLANTNMIHLIQTILEHSLPK